MSRLTVLFALLAAGCQPVPTPIPRATARFITVQTAPALLSMRDIFYACAAEQPGLGIVVLEPSVSATPQPADITLRWGAGKSPLPGFAAQIGQEELVIVVHPENPVESISLADLRSIYMGSLREWKGPDSGEIEPWAYPGSDDTQAVFEAAILDGSPIAPRVAATAPDPGALIEGVSANPNSIGFLPRRWLNTRVKALPVEGLTTDQVRQPILALSNSEPEGQQKSWLLCLQDQLQ